MTDSRVARLAALLAECPFLFTVNDYGAIGPGLETAEAYGMKGGVAEWLIARGVTVGAAQGLGVGVGALGGGGEGGPGGTTT